MEKFEPNRQLLTRDDPFVAMPEVELEIFLWLRYNNRSIEQPGNKVRTVRQHNRNPARMIDQQGVTPVLGNQNPLHREATSYRLGERQRLALTIKPQLAAKAQPGRQQHQQRDRKSCTKQRQQAVHF